MRHSLINDILWRAIKKAQVSACKEPVGLSRSDGKRPDGATLIPCSHGKPLAWDVTAPDTFAQTHITSTATNAGASAAKAADACSKTKIRTSEYYSQLYSIRSGNRRFLEL